MFTQEQQDIINLILSPESDNKIVAVNAVAGSGKTTTAKGIIEAYKPEKGFYTAFNKSVIEEAKIKLNLYGMQINTIHSFAYRFLNGQYNKIEELSYINLEKANYNFKRLVINLLDSFFRSKYLSLKEFIYDHVAAIKKELYLEDIDTSIDDIFEYSNNILNKMIKKEMSATYNFLLKMTHYYLAKGETVEYDLVILDEAQDTTAVALEIFKLIKAKKKVILGDTYQNIYNFMGTVNAFNKLKDNIILKHLTQSFRCSPVIADKVETFGKKYFYDDFKYTGTELPEFVENEDTTTVYLVRHNMALIMLLSNALGRRLDFRLIREPKEIFAFAISLLTASLGKEVFDKRFKHLEIIYKKFEKNVYNSENIVKSKQKQYFDYLLKEIPNDEQLEAGIRMLEVFNQKQINLFDLKKEVEEKNNPKAKLTISTVHTFKGLEADKVIIHNSLNSMMTNVIAKLKELKDMSKNNPSINLGEFIKSDPITYIEPFNLYYVALSRAKYIVEGNTIQ